MYRLPLGDGGGLQVIDRVEALDALNGAGHLSRSDDLAAVGALLEEGEGLTARISIDPELAHPMSGSDEPEVPTSYLYATFSEEARLRLPEVMASATGLMIDASSPREDEKWCFEREGERGTGSSCYCTTLYVPCRPGVYDCTQCSDTDKMFRVVAALYQTEEPFIDPRPFAEVAPGEFI